MPGAIADEPKTSAPQGRSNATGAAAQRGGRTVDARRDVDGDDDDDAAAMEPAVAFDAVLNVKEVGGRMMASWGRFVADAGRCLVYVVDASAPWYLPTAAVELYSLLVEHGCSEWKVLVIVNKVTMPAALPYQDVCQLLCLPQLRDAHPEMGLTVTVVDTWSGRGLENVVTWLMRAGAHQNKK